MKSSRQTTLQSRGRDANSHFTGPHSSNKDKTKQKNQRNLPANCQMSTRTPNKSAKTSYQGRIYSWVTITATQRKFYYTTSIYSNHQELGEQTTKYSRFLLRDHTTDCNKNKKTTGCEDAFPMTYRCSFQTSEDKSRDKQLYPNLCRMRHCITSEKTRLDKRGQQRV